MSEVIHESMTPSGSSTAVSLGMPAGSAFSTEYILGGVWEQSFSAVLEEYCSILKYCSIIYIMVFGKLGKISVFKTEVLQIL